MTEVFTKPFEGVGVDVTGLNNGERRKAADLSWDAIAQPTQTYNPVTFEPMDLPGNRVVMRNDGKGGIDGTGILGYVGNRYTIVQPKAAFDFADILDREGEVDIETMGHFGGGSTMWVLARVPEGAFEAKPGDEVVPYFLFRNSFDGSSGVVGGLVSTRVVCWNTLAHATKEAKGSAVGFNLRHTASVEDKLEAARKAIARAAQAHKEFGTFAQRLAQAGMSSAQWSDFSLALVPDPVKEGASNAKADNIRGRMTELFLSGRGNQGKTAWDALNAVTEWANYAASARNQESRLKSLWFGANGKRATNAVSLLTDFANVTGQ
jgi:phage/plasmid-like protein (TIGR03299 family)